MIKKKDLWPRNQIIQEVFLWSPQTGNILSEYWFSYHQCIILICSMLTCEYENVHRRETKRSQDASCVCHIFNKGLFDKKNIWLKSMGLLWSINWNNAAVLFHFYIRSSPGHYSLIIIILSIICLIIANKQFGLGEYTWWKILQNKRKRINAVTKLFYNFRHDTLTTHKRQTGKLKLNI